MVSGRVVRVAYSDGRRCSVCCRLRGNQPLPPTITVCLSPAPLAGIPLNGVAGIPQPRRPNEVLGKPRKDVRFSEEAGGASVSELARARKMSLSDPSPVSHSPEDVTELVAGYGMIRARPEDLPLP